MSGNETGKRYLEADVLTASPLRLVVIVCDFGIDCLNKAAGAAESPDGEGKLEEFTRLTGKARDALLELMGALAPERSPQMAGNLLALYGYFFRRITEARAKVEAAPLKEVAKLWSSLRDAWADVLKSGEEGKAHAEAGEAGRFVSVTG